MSATDYEKLGLFYLGRRYDLATRTRERDLVLYESQDLVTHAVCVGMTGSGKTGLCLDLLEEAAIDGIPAIAIDPKGDLANLLLQFPSLAPGDFEPWVDAEEARRRGVTPADLAAQEARKWAEGLAEWDQSGERIARLAKSAEFAVYTPGSNAGRSISILRSFAAPPAAVVEDAETFRERVESTSTSLLGLLGIDVDPLQSREHILLANLLDRAWRAGEDLDLAGLIQAIQAPPFERIGVFELEAFYPAKERFQLAMRLNNLLASPGFATWLEGEPLDVGSLLWTKEGKPRIAIVSIAHLSEPERMFFVSMLLNQVLGWMRTQSGTSSLRALFYMDEIFGYFPPVANPPSKKPLLTLLKQARAFGLGCVLATQNPVDLDYKGLANCGTWFVGRLQTERDKARLVDGLEGAAQDTFDRAKMEQTLAQLGKRVFLLHSVHRREPVTFETRFALCYLRGPMTRTEIKKLMDPRRGAVDVAGASGEAARARPAASSTAPARGVPADDASRATSDTSTSNGPATARSAARETSSRPSAPAASTPPIASPDVPHRFAPVTVTAPAGASLVYERALFGRASVLFEDKKLEVEVTTEPKKLATGLASATTVDWESALDVEFDEDHFEPAPRAGATFGPLASGEAKVKSDAAWRRELVDALYRSERVELLQSPTFDVTSLPVDTERDFRIRLQALARERRDAAKDGVRQKLAPKFASLDEKLRRAQQRLEKEREQSRDSKVGGAFSFGASVLGVLFGRKTLSAATVSRAGTAARSVGRMSKEASDVERAGEDVEALARQKEALEAEAAAALAAIDATYDPLTEPLERVPVKPKKSNVGVRWIGLVWAPYWVAPDGARTPAFPLAAARRT